MEFKLRKGIMLSDMIKTGKQDLPFRVVIYGSDGIGKSSWAAQSPKPLFLDIEDGIGQINVDSVSLSDKPFEEVVKFIRLLLNEEHDYKTLVIDSIDWLEQKIWKKVVHDFDKPIKSIEDIGYAKGYTFALDHFNTLIRGLEKLRKEKNMNIILIAHGAIIRVEDPMFDAYDKWCLKLHRKARAVIQEWADCILFAAYETMTKKVGESFGQDKYKAIGDAERVLHTQEKPFFEAKTRYLLPETLPLEFEAFQQSINETKQ